MILILAAAKQEASGLVRWLKYHGKRGDVVLATTGMGRTRAMSSAGWLIQQNRPDLVLHLGFGGAINPHLKTGDLVLCNRLHLFSGEGLVDTKPALEPQRQFLYAAENVAQRAELPYRLAASLTTLRLVRTADQKASLGEQTGAAVVDLESYWVAQAACTYGVPFLSVRAVFDPASQSLPPFVAALVEGTALTRPVRFLGALITEPWSIKESLALRRQARLAQEGLTAFARAFLAFLATPPARRTQIPH